MEDFIKMKEIQLETNNSEENRLELRNAEKELMQYYKIEEEYWKQNAGMTWFKDGDRNTKFFHSYVIGRRRKLIINEIKNAKDAILKETREIGDEAVRVFKEQFSEQGTSEEYIMIYNLPKLITEDQRIDMDNTLRCVL